jgi:hypothetical protein
MEGMEGMERVEDAEKYGVREDRNAEQLARRACGWVASLGLCQFKAASLALIRDHPPAAACRTLQELKPPCRKSKDSVRIVRSV